MVLVSSPERVIQGVSCKLGAPWDVPGGNRDRGEPHGSTPPTPPCVRVRTRRFGKRQGLHPLAFVDDPCRELLGPLASPRAFTFFALPTGPLSGGRLPSMLVPELPAPGTFAVWPFPVDHKRSAGTMASADSCAAVRVPYGSLSPLSDTAQASRGKPDRLPRTPAGFTAMTLGGYGLRCLVPARPVTPASYPVSVRQVAVLPTCLSTGPVDRQAASFRPRLTTTPLRFASTSPPPGCAGDFHPLAVEHARHTQTSGPLSASPPGFVVLVCRAIRWRARPPKLVPWQPLASGC